MRFLIPAALVAAVLFPAAADACTRCIYHGEARENAAWEKILAKPDAKAAKVAKVTATKPAPAATPSPAPRPRTR